jgi:hypothetical protein
MHRAVFEGLVVDEFDKPASVVYIGDEPCYVVDDQGFKRHIPSEDVDRQVISQMAENIQGNEDVLAEMAARQLGQEDIFSKAIIEAQLKNAENYLENLFEAGLPEEARTYLGMMGFRIRINIHGEVIEVEQPGIISPEDE